MENVYKEEELIPIVAELAEKYTGKSSTSITYEKAHQLMEAVLYCIHECETADENRLKGQKENAKQLYDAGYAIILEKANQLRSMYNDLINFFQSYGNICLSDTIVKGIPEFFKWYDARYAPQETILTLDYPILSDISMLSGIDAVWEYLRCIYLEQMFLGCLPFTYVWQALNDYSEEHEQLIENICYMVLAKMSEKLLQELDEKENLTRQNLEEQIKLLIKGLAEKTGDEREDVTEYLNRSADDIAIRLMQYEQR